MPPPSVLFGRRSLKALIFMGNFGVARIAVYLIPLGIAATTAPDVYGAVEFAQSASLLGAALLLGGLLAGASQDYLVRKQPLSLDVVAASVTVASLVAAAVALAVWAFGGSQVAILTCLALGLASIHSTLSAILRTLSMRNLTAWTDGIFVIVTMAIVLLAFLFRGSVTPADLILGNAIVCLAGIIGGAAITVRSLRPGFASRLRQMARFGAPVVVSGAFAMWQAGAGRILTGLFAAEALAAYGIAFRIAGLALGLHQLAATAFFAHIYAGRTRAVDRLLTYFLVAVMLALFAIVILARAFVTEDLFNALDARGLALFRAVLPIVALQVFFWVANAMLEARLTRFGLAARTILPSMLINGAALGALIALDWLGNVSLAAICWAVAAQSAAFFAIGGWLLAQRRVPHRRIMIAGSAGGAALAAFALL